MDLGAETGLGSSSEWSKRPKCLARALLWIPEQGMLLCGFCRQVMCAGSPGWGQGEQQRLSYNEQLQPTLKALYDLYSIFARVDSCSFSLPICFKLPFLPFKNIQLNSHLCD